MYTEKVNRLDDVLKLDAVGCNDRQYTDHTIQMRRTEKDRHNQE